MADDTILMLSKLKRAGLPNFYENNLRNTSVLIAMKKNPDMSMFKTFMQEQENAPLLNDFRAGKIIPGTRFKSHLSPEGGLNTSGFGHKFQTKEEQDLHDEQGVFFSEILKQFDDDIIDRGFIPAAKQVDKLYGKGTFINLDPIGQLMLADIMFQTGNIFPRATKKIVENDLNGALEELDLSEKLAEKKGYGKAIKARNKARREFYTKLINEK